MVRIQCECGKILKVGDTLLGKRVKCPACGAAQLVKHAPQAIVEAIPKALSEEHTAPSPPPKKKRQPPPPSVSLCSKPRRDDDDDDFDDMPRKKKRPKKAGNATLLLLVGGGAAAVLLLLVGGGLLWFMLSRTEPVAEVKPAKTVVAAPQPETYAIKLCRAPRQGRTRRGEGGDGPQG